jgi:hypothetical protein
VSVLADLKESTFFLRVLSSVTTPEPVADKLHARGAKEVAKFVGDG